MARLRSGSLRPRDIIPVLLWLRSDPRLMRHFHLALQSGSEGTLAAMRRRYIPVYAAGRAGLRTRITPAKVGAVYHDGVRGILEGGDAA